jgi:aryl-alcohol dehydrogenase-like predicted oxidoreductase
MFRDEIAAIGYGAMRLSIQERPPEEEARRVLHAALDAGMTLIDTADVYCLDDGDIGHNERLIASVVGERSDRDRVRVATKGGLTRPRGTWTSDGRPGHIREACERSLRALGVDQIYLYQFHAPDPGVPFEKSIETFAELQREGKCLHVGLSNVNVKQIDVAESIVKVASVQNRFSVFFREPLENGVADLCERREIAFLAYSPLGGGRLARRAGKHPVLLEIGRRHGATPQAVSLAWLRAKSRVVVPIPGPSRLRNVEDCASAATLALAPEEVDAISGAEFSRA